MLRRAGGLAGVFLLLLSVTAGFLVLETTLRLLHRPSLALSRQPAVYVEDEGYGYRYIPKASDWIRRYYEINNLVEINSMGFHDVERPAGRPAEEIRIAAVGDSSTASTHVGTADTWTQVLRREVRRLDGTRTWDVINLGIDGTGTDVHLRVLQEHLPILGPDIVLLAFAGNDIRDISLKRQFRESYKGYVLAFQSRQQRGQLRKFVDTYRPGPWRLRLYEKSYLFRAAVVGLRKVDRDLIPGTIMLTTNYLSPSRIGLTPRLEDERPRDINKLMAEFLLLAEKHGFRLFVAPVPMKEDPEGGTRALVESVEEGILEKLEILDVPGTVLAILGERGLDYGDLFWLHDGHFNELGNEVYGRAVARLLGLAGV